MHLEIYAQNISIKNFSKYGYVLDIDNDKCVLINDGSCIKYNFDFDFYLSRADSRYRAKLYVAKKHDTPITLNAMERHPKGHQLFYPINDSPYFVAVAPSSGIIDEDLIEVFYVPPGIGVVIRCGTWHHSLLAICDNSKYFVFENDASGNCETQSLIYTRTIASCLSDFLPPFI